MGPVVIVFLDLTSDGDRCFVRAVLGRPDLLFLKAAMEPFDIAVVFWVMIGRAPVRDAKPSERA